MVLIIQCHTQVRMWVRDTTDEEDSWREGIWDISGCQIIGTDDKNRQISYQFQNRPTIPPMSSYNSNKL